MRIIAGESGEPQRFNKNQSLAVSDFTRMAARRYQSARNNEETDPRRRIINEIAAKKIRNGGAETAFVSPAYKGVRNKYGVSGFLIQQSGGAAWSSPRALDLH
ncbi:MAG: hypothetical protein ACOX41_10800 [Anaerovoracaceae bacterium]|jgi:hypothetical protein